MLNSGLLKFGAVNLDNVTVIHLDGDFDSVLTLLQGQVTSDCTQISNQFGQISSLCDEKGESGDDAGLQAGDVIIEFNGKEIKFGSDLPHVVGRIQPKTKANAKIIRDGKNVNLKFTLGELPADERTFIPAKSEISSDPLGLKIEDLSEENSRPNDPENGVLVLRVNNGSPAYGKLTRGDIITEVISQGKRHTIEDAESFEDLVEEFEEGDKLAIVGRRNNNRFFVAVTVD